MGTTMTMGGATMPEPGHTPTGEGFSLAMQLIADYCLNQGWTPVGFRRFEIHGIESEFRKWTITINGTPDTREHVPPWHCLVVECNGLPVGLLSPRYGTILGQVTEDALIAALRQAGAKTWEPV